MQTRIFGQIIRKSAVIAATVALMSCASTHMDAPGSTKILNAQHESQAEKIGWMKACQMAVKAHPQAACLNDYFSDEVRYQREKIRNLDKTSQDSIEHRSDFLSREFIEAPNALDQCIAAHKLGVSMLNKMNELGGAYDNSAANIKSPELCLTPNEDRIIRSGGAD